MFNKPSRLASSFITVCCAALALGAVAMAPATASQPIKIHHDDPALEWGGCPDGFPDGCRIAVLQGDPARPNADIFLKLAPDSRLSHHWHTSAERMILVAGEFHVDFDGHPPVVMRAGSYGYAPARMPHQAHCAEGDACILFIAFEAPVDTIFTGR